MFTTGEIVSAATMNVVSNDLDALNTKANNTATVATAETRANAAYGDLATVGPTVSSLTTGTFVFVFLASKFNNNSVHGGAFMSVDVSGATTIAAADGNSVGHTFADATVDLRAGIPVPLTVTAGSNTFKAKYRSSGGDTATFTNRVLIVMPQF